MRNEAVLFVTFVLAGCGAPSAMLDPIDDSTPMSRILLTGCTGGVARMDAPSQTTPAPVPPGWEVDDDLPTTVTMFALFCEHVSLGSFERGPVELVVESHGTFDAAENCRDGDYTFLNVLTRMVWSDSEIADAMQEQLGIPTSVGTVSRTSTGNEVASLKLFSWEIDGQVSEFQVGEFQNEMTRTETTYRYVWADGGRLGLIDFSWDAVQTQFEPTLAVGRFAPPMLLSSAGMPVVFGVGVVEAEAFPGGQFLFFEGSECATPSSR